MHILTNNDHIFLYNLHIIYELREIEREGEEELRGKSFFENIRHLGWD
jgi:hypothetical protein